MNNRLHNIISFTIIFLSGDLNILHESPSYILEKFHRYIGDKVEINKHKETSFFKRYKKIWKTDDYRINSIVLFLENVLNFKYNNRDKELDPYGEEDWNELDYYDGYVPDIFSYEEDYGAGIRNVAINPDDYFQLFDEFIGDVENVSTIKEDGLHYILKRDMFDVYKKIKIKKNPLKT